MRQSRHEHIGRYGLSVSAEKKREGGQITQRGNLGGDNADYNASRIKIPEDVKTPGDDETPARSADIVIDPDV